MKKKSFLVFGIMIVLCLFVVWIIANNSGKEDNMPKEQNVKSKIVKNKDDSKLFIGKGEFVSKITTEKFEMIFAMFRNQEGRVYCAINKADKKDFSKILHLIYFPF